MPNLCVMREGNKPQSEGACGPTEAGKGQDHTIIEFVGKRPSEEAKEQVGGELYASHRPEHRSTMR